MSEEQKPQNDFFSDLMFGRPPSPPEQETSQSADPKSESNLEVQQSKEGNQPQEPKQPDQLESIFALVESLGPFIAKLSPLASTISSYFSQNKKDDSNNKNAND